MTRIDPRFQALTRALGKSGEVEPPPQDNAQLPGTEEAELDTTVPDVRAQLDARQRAQGTEAQLMHGLQALAAGVEHILESMGINVDLTPDVRPGDPAAGSLLSQQDVLEALKGMGLDVGPTLDDPKTKAAIKQFQAAAGLEETGQLDMDTLMAVLESRLNNDRRARSGSSSGSVHGTQRPAGSQGADIPAGDPQRTKPVDTSNWKAGKGDVTPDQLQQIVPGLSAQRAAEVAPHLNRAMAEAGIDNPQRKAAFIAQLAHESGGFKYMEEIASGRQYEGRRDLGNTQPGDGERFKGRGFIQVTGRANYAAASKALGEDFVNHPERAGTLENAARMAAWYWNSRGLNAKADRGDFDGITKSINGGFNGKADRDRYYHRALEVLKNNDGLPSTGQFEEAKAPASLDGSSLKTGSFASRIADAAEREAANTNTVGYCAKSVNKVLNSLGVGGYGNAYQKAEQLAKNPRFKEISVSPDQLKQLPRGAVLVWGRSAEKPYGHVTVALGNGREASDHIQNLITRGAYGSDWGNGTTGGSNVRVFIPQG
jgi:predicted chitinase